MQKHWRELQKQNFTDWQELALFLQLSKAQCKDILEKSVFPLNLPQRLAHKITKGKIDDPLLLQFLPQNKELTPHVDFTLDPLKEKTLQKTPKLLHKYQGRALLICTSACAMHCRFCFRQHYYEKTKKGFQKEMEAIRNDPSIREIILSGGDPLSLSNPSLSALFSSLKSIPHLKRLRLHSRFPLGIPERIDTALLSLFKLFPLQIIFIIHCNHPKELDRDVLLSLKKVQQLGIPLLCQSVLLKGVNDSFSTLYELYEILSSAGIIPYYLHQLDHTQGTAHFEVSEKKGKMLMEALKKQLPGYALPRYVKEEAGKCSKSLILA